MKAKNAWVQVIILSLIVMACGNGKIDPGSLELYAEASSAWAQGDWKTAAEKAASIQGAYTTFFVAGTLEGKAVFMEGETLKAIDILERVVRNRPEAREALVWLIRSYRSAENSEKAAAAIEKALAGDPGDIRLLRLASLIARDAQEQSKALAYLDSAIERGSELALAYLDRARYQAGSDRNENALEDLAVAKSLIPEGSSLKQSIDVLAGEIKKNNAVSRTGKVGSP